MASRGLNKVMLIGRLGQDPEIRYLQNGAAVANVNLATSDVWKDKQTGEQKERTEWHRVVIFGKLAEIVGEYARKGSQVYVEGALQTRQWTDDSNITRYTTEVMVNVGGSVQLLGSKQNGTSGVNSPEWAEQSGRVAPSSTSQQPPEPALDLDDDIPF